MTNARETSAGGISAVKLALVAREARAKAGAALAADPVAIVGMGCRFPGGGNDPERFWSFLLEARDAVGPVPADRWDPTRWHGGQPGAEVLGPTPAAAFLDRIDGFDADYFSILAREAEQMDPQQRLFLEVAIESIEDAGLRFEDLRGSRTGVFAASYHNDYAQMLYRAPHAMDERTLTGTLHSIVANRLSYLLDLRGPSVSVDTACSASLVAIHLACQSLRSGESDIALAGGVSLMIGPELMVAMSRLGFLAPDGRSKTFDAAADGFGRGEGCGVITLKRLSDAITDGDRIWAVIRGSVVNQDGESTLLVAPNGQAQVALLREAIAASRIDPDAIVYVETHGTGTALGDPLEVEALAETVGRPGHGRPACLLGAVKSNIGHLEAAAGVAGVIKAALVLSHGEVPAQPGFVRLNPHIRLDGTRLAVAAQRAPLPATAMPAAAGVSSFGVGGTNAHLVLEAAPDLGGGETQAAEGAVWTLPLSARSPAALADLAAVWTGLLRKPGAPLADLCHTAACRRTHHPYRLAVSGTSRDALAARLSARAAEATRATEMRLCFVFSGQGSQWHGMGRELLATEPHFAAHMERADSIVRQYCGWSLLEELSHGEKAHRLAETAIAQPALVALQTGVAALLRARGLAPDTCIGHSVGEIAAVEVAGILSLEEAIRIACHRGRIMQEADGSGGMAMLHLAEAEAAKVIAGHGEMLDIAAINAPGETVISGDPAALDEVLSTLGSQGVGHRRLPVRYAFHSAQMIPFETELANALGEIACGAPIAEVISTVTGAPVTRIDARHVAGGIRTPVRFADAVRSAARGPTVFVEIGPHPALATSIAGCIGEAGAPAPITTLRRNRPEREALAEAVGRLYELGRDPDWSAVLPANGAVVSLPPYSWQHRRYWRDVAAAVPVPAGHDTGHPLLGRRLSLATRDLAVFEGSSEAAGGWLWQHRIFGRAVAPATAMLELLAAAGREVVGPDVRLADFAVTAPLAVPPPGEAPARWQTVAHRGRDGWSLTLHAARPSVAESGFHVVAEARATADAAVAVLDTAVFSGTEREPEVVPDAEIDAHFRRIGAEFGPAFRLLREVSRGPGGARGRIAVPESFDAAPHLVHPAALDAGVQLCVIAAAGSEDVTWLPVGAAAIRLGSPTLGRDLMVQARLSGGDEAAGLAADVIYSDADGVELARIEGLRFAATDGAAFRASVTAAPRIYEMHWKEDPEQRETARPPGAVLLVAPPHQGDALAEVLARDGAAVRRIDTDAPPKAFTAALEWLQGEEGPWQVLDLSGLEAGADAVAAVASALTRVQAMVMGNTGAALAMVTRGAFATGAGVELPNTAAAALHGFASTVALEHPELSVRCLDIDTGMDAPQALAKETAEALSVAGSARLAMRDERRLVPILVDRQPTVAPARTLSLRGGGFESLKLAEGRRRPLARGEVRVAVRAAGLNFRDVLATLGLYPGATPPLGAECAGEVIEAAEGSDLTAGDRVFGYAPGALAEEVVVPATLLVRIPAGMSDREAAGLTVPFGTALYGLNRLANLRQGERVLIHAGAGGVGLAAVGIALARGAEVYATAGSAAKRALLEGLGVTRAMDSRSRAFEAEIATATRGLGVDVVLNSLAGDFIAASVRTLAPEGRFLEIGKRDLMTPEAFAALRPRASYHVYDFGQRIEDEPGLLRQILAEVLAAFSAGTLRTLPITTFGLDRTAEAMRHMAAARHVGKIVICVPPRRTGLRRDATYWITGGLGGLGLLTARWLAERGARHIVLSGRSAPDEVATAAIAEIARSGATVRTIAADMADAAAVARVLATIAEEMPPLRGIVHAAGTLRDGPVLTRTADDVAAVLGGKLAGAQTLDRLTRDLPLDFFVLYGAAATLLGSPGQSLYVAANAGLDAVVASRRRKGLPGLCVAWGAWAGAGMAARLATERRDVWAERGLGGLTAETGFSCLEALLGSGAAQAAVIAADWSRFADTAPRGLDLSPFATLTGDAYADRHHPVLANQRSLAERLDAEPPQTRRATLTAHVAQAAREIIGLPSDAPIGPDRPLRDIGIDSLMAVELRNLLARASGLSLPATLLFDFPTISRLVERLAAPLGVPPSRPQPAEPEQAHAGVAEGADLEDLSEVELAALLDLEATVEAGLPTSKVRG